MNVTTGIFQTGRHPANRAGNDVSVFILGSDNLRASRDVGLTRESLIRYELASYESGL